MQMALFRNLVEVIPHIKFDCTVNGKELTAAVTHKEYCGGQTLYLVSFSNGHQDMYVPGDEQVHSGFGRTRTMDCYEEAVFDDLCVIPLLVKGNRYTSIHVQEVSGDSFNVWIRERKGFYSTFYKGQYQFTLCRHREQWLVNTMRKEGYVVNQQLARLVSKHLDLYGQPP